MNLKDINQSLIGQRASFMFKNVKGTGTITNIIDMPAVRGVRIQFDQPNALPTSLEACDFVSPQDGNIQDRYIPHSLNTVQLI